MTIWPERVRYQFGTLGCDSHSFLVPGAVWIIAYKACIL